jgi:hypothetical protein
MSIYSGYPRRHSKMITGGSGMKIINSILLSERIRLLNFNSVDSLNKAAEEVSYPLVDCDDDGKVQFFYEDLINNPRIKLSTKTLDTLRRVKGRLEIFDKLGT